MGCFKGSSTSESAPTTSKTQQALEAEVAGWLKGQIGQGAAPYGKELYAAMPESFQTAFDNFVSEPYGDIQQQTTSNLMQGVPAYQFDPVKTTADWQKNYATPIMDTWRETIAPMLREGMNMPGTFYSRGTTDYMADQAGQFFGGNVAPSLFNALQAGENRGFQSAEAAAGRQPGALNIPFQQFQQQAGAAGMMQAAMQAPITADFQEFLRTRAEPGWAVNAAQGFAFPQTIQSGFGREPSFFEMFGSTIGGLAGSMNKKK